NGFLGRKRFSRGRTLRARLGHARLAAAFRSGTNRAGGSRRRDVLHEFADHPHQFDGTLPGPVEKPPGERVRPCDSGRTGTPRSGLGRDDRRSSDRPRYTESKGARPNEATQPTRRNTPPAPSVRSLGDRWSLSDGNHTVELPGGATPLLKR